MSEQRDLTASSSQLETEVARTSDITNGFSTQMTEEYEFFQRSKTAELKQSLSAYADSRIEFYSNVSQLLVNLAFIRKTHMVQIGNIAVGGNSTCARADGCCRGYDPGNSKVKTKRISIFMYTN